MWWQTQFYWFSCKKNTEYSGSSLKSMCVHNFALSRKYLDSQNDIKMILSETGYECQILTKLKSLCSLSREEKDWDHDWDLNKVCILQDWETFVYQLSRKLFNAAVLRRLQKSANNCLNQTSLAADHQAILSLRKKQKIEFKPAT